MVEQEPRDPWWRRWGSTWRWILAGAAVLVVLLLLCNLFFGWLERFAAMRAFSYVVSRLCEHSGWDPNLVKAGTALLMLPYLLAVFRLARLELPIVGSLFRGKGMSKGLAQAIVTLGVSGYFLALSFAEQGSNISRWYVLDANYRVHYAHHGGIEAHTLLPLQPVTADIVPVLERIEAGERPKDISSSDPTQVAFFSPATRTALVWYCDQGS